MAQFSDKVRMLLKKTGMSQADLAAAMGTDQPQISRWLDAGKPPAKTANLWRMAQALSRPGRPVPMEYLLDDAQDDLPAPSERSDDDRQVLDLFHALGLTRDEALRRLAGPGAAEAGVPPIVAGPRKPTPAGEEAGIPPIVAGPRKKGPVAKKAGGAGGKRRGAG